MEINENSPFGKINIRFSYNAANVDNVESAERPRMLDILIRRDIGRGVCVIHYACRGCESTMLSGPIRAANARPPPPTFSFLWFLDRD